MQYPIVRAGKFGFSLKHFNPHRNQEKTVTVILRRVISQENVSKNICGDCPVCGLRARFPELCASSRTSNPSVSRIRHGSRVVARRQFPCCLVVDAACAKAFDYGFGLRECLPSAATLPCKCSVAPSCSVPVE